MFEITTKIERPPGEVFARLARIEDAPLWYSAVQSVERRDPGPVQVGTRYRFTRQLAGKTVDNEVEVSEFEPDQAFALSSVTGPTPFVYRYVLERSGTGSLLRLEGSISADGLGGPLAMLGSVAEAFFKRGMASNLETFKRLVEDG